MLGQGLTQVSPAAKRSLPHGLNQFITLPAQHTEAGTDTRKRIAPTTPQLKIS